MEKQATVIGPHTYIRGIVEGDEDLLIVGRVDGNINLTKSLFIDPAGVVVADVQVKQAMISGTVVGNIMATELIHISEKGKVVGDLAAPRVVLVDGASYKGNIDMGDLDAPVVKTAPSTAPVISKASFRPAPAPEKRTSLTAGLRRVAEQPTARPSPAKVSRTVTPPTEEPLEKRAEAAAEALAKAARSNMPPKAKGASPSTGKSQKEGEKASSAPSSSGKPIKPPTAAGKKSRARRK